MKQATTNQLDSSSIRTKSFKKWYIIALGTFIYLYVVSFGAFVRSLTRASIEDYSKIPCIKNEFDIMKEKLFFNYCEIEKSIIIIASILLNTAIYKYYKRSTYSKDDIISIAFAGLYYLIFIFYVVYSTIKSLNKTRLPSPCLSVDTDLYINVKIVFNYDVATVFVLNLFWSIYCFSLFIKFNMVEIEDNSNEVSSTKDLNTIV